MLAGGRLMSTARAELTTSIACTVGDYRFGELAAPTPAHIETWISQFAVPAQLPILCELDHVLKKTYLSKPRVESFLSVVCTSPKLCGPDPAQFWRATNFLNIQKGGSSQADMLQLFAQQLHVKYGISLEQCGSTQGGYVYLDDAIFTGNRILKDLTAWAPQAPAAPEIHVVVVGLHAGGRYYADKKITEAFSHAGKAVKLHWWSVLQLEDRKAYTDSADVLRPTAIPPDPLVHQYVSTLKYPPHLRTGAQIGGKALYSSPQGRETLEQEFLKGGATIRAQCPNLGNYQRPLGNMVLDTLGFGSTFVTFRNCPHNCPLVFWAGAPWYPLFPRKTN